MTAFIAGQYPEAVVQGIKFLNEVREFAPDTYEHEPKGTPLYYMAIAAFHSHDFQTASFLFDAAVSEDLKTNPRGRTAPAVLFMLLNVENQNQAALASVEYIVRSLNTLLQRYSAKLGALPIDLPELREAFLRRALTQRDASLRTLVTTLVSYILEWEYRRHLINLNAAGTQEPFLVHLLKGCVLFESLLKASPKHRSKRGEHAKLTLGQLLPLVHTDLGLRRSPRIGKTTLRKVIGRLGSNNSVYQSVAITGRARNTIGHNLVWSSARLDQNSYDLLAENILMACIHALSRLYR